MLDRRLEVSIQHQTFATLVVVRGVVDTHSVAVLESELQQAIGDCVARPARLMLDLSGMDYIDRDGLDCLLRTQHSLLAQSGHLGLSGPDRSAVVRMLHQAEHEGESWLAPPGWSSSPDGGRGSAN